MSIAYKEKNSISYDDKSRVTYEIKINDRSTVERKIKNLLYKYEFKKMKSLQ